MHMGQMIQSHALNFYHLSSPDLILGFDADPAVRNVFGIIEKDPELARQGIRLRKFGQEIIEKIAGKRIRTVLDSFCIVSFFLKISKIPMGT